MFAVYRRSLRFYPVAFRTRFSDEMLQLLRDRLAYEGRVPWRRTYADLLRSVAVERWKESSSMKKVWPVAIGLVAAVLVTRVVVGSGWTARTAAIVGIEIAFVLVVVGAARLLAHRVRGAEYDYSARRLRWWWIPAGLIGAAELFLGTGQLVRDPKPSNVFALGIALCFSALVFGGMAVTNRYAGNLMIAVGVAPMLPVFWLIAPTVVSLLVIVCALADNVRIGRARPRTVIA